MDIFASESDKNNEDIICPSGKCLNIPEIIYKFNPLKSEIHYKCKCHNNYEQKTNISPKDFLEKSKYFICNDCNKKINCDDIFFFCNDCKKIFDKKCIQNHTKDLKHFNFDAIQRNNLYNLCREHNESFFLRCKNCKELLCKKCKIDIHMKDNHSLQKIEDFLISKKELNDKNLAFKKQKDIFDKIKKMSISNNNSFKVIENDIKIKQKIINSYNKNRSNFNSIINFKKLYIKNDEKYEKIIYNFLNINEGKENDESRLNKFIDENLILIYYSLMINKDKSLNDSILKNIGKKLFNFETDKYFNNEEKNSINDNNVKNNNDSKGSNTPNKMDIENNQINTNNENNNKVKNVKESKGNEKENSEKKKSKSSSEIKEHKKEKDNKKISEGEQNNMFISNMIELKSGNFAISYRNTIEIYDLRKLNYENEIKSFDNLSIKKSKCFLQKIYPDKDNKKHVNYVYEFTDGILLCPTFSKIIIVKLTNNDQSYEIIGHINLCESELTRKMISLKEYLVLLNEQHHNCHIKLFKQNSLNNGDIKKNFIFDMKDQISNKAELLVSIFEIKKIINKSKENDDNYLYEFIATSNADYTSSKDKIIFYGIKNDKIEKIKEINGISCSVEPDSICQINEKIICIGLQNYSRGNQMDGFALIDISKRELYKIIKDQYPISSICYYKEKNLIIASMQIQEKDGDDYYSTNIYKIMENKGDKGTKEIEFKKVYEYKNMTKNVVISINKIQYPTDDIIFVTSTCMSYLEVIKAKIEN